MPGQLASAGPQSSRAARALLAAVTLLLVAVGGGCRHAPVEPAPEVVARVGDGAVTRPELEQLAGLSRQPSPFAGLLPDERLPDDVELVRELVRQRLLEQEARRRGLHLAPGVSARDALAVAIAEGLAVDDEQVRRFIDQHPELYTRKAQVRFLHLRAPPGGAALPDDPSPAELGALCEAASAADPAGRRWGDIGWLQVGHAPWRRQPPWDLSKSLRPTSFEDAGGNRHLLLAMHYRPAARYSAEQVWADARQRLLAELGQAELKRLLLELARTTKVTVVDGSAAQFDPCELVRGEPGPPCELLDPARAAAARSRDMVRLEGGSFTTGSTAAEIDERVATCRRYVEPALGPGSCAREKYEDEVQRPVTAASFWLDRTEVTVADYREFAVAARHRPPAGAAAERPDLPVTGVSLEDAAAYCHWRGRRLPTADEWEYAARGRSSRRYAWGDQAPDGTRGNFCDARCPAAWRNPDHDDGFEGLAPVGSYPAGATPEGVLDLAGNAREWTSSRTGGLAAVKGGGFRNAIDDLIAADVRSNHVETRDDAIGFRCAASTDGE